MKLGHWMWYVFPQLKGLGSSHLTNAFSKKMELQSAPPTRGATKCSGRTRRSRSCFHPRPPRGGRLSDALGWCHVDCFNPRPPRGGRPVFDVALVFYHRFQSAPPTRGATGEGGGGERGWPVSIRAPHAGGDGRGGRGGEGMASFNPRPPRGGRRTRSCRWWRWRGFNPRPPRGGRLPSRTWIGRAQRVSIRAPHAGGDPVSAPVVGASGGFNPRPPRGGRRGLA